MMRRRRRENGEGGGEACTLFQRVEGGREYMLPSVKQGLFVELLFDVRIASDEHRLLADSWVFWEPRRSTHTAEEPGLLGWTSWTARGLRRVCLLVNILGLELRIAVSQIGKKKGN